VRIWEKWGQETRGQEKSGKTERKEKPTQLCTIITINPLSSNSDENNEIYLYLVTPCCNVQVTRIKEVITKDIY